MDYTSYVISSAYEVIGARKHPEVDPWGFLYPFSPLLWATLMGVLLIVSGFMMLKNYCLPVCMREETNQAAEHTCLRVLLQQGRSITLKVIFISNVRLV